VRHARESEERSRSARAGARFSNPFQRGRVEALEWAIGRASAYLRPSTERHVIDQESQPYARTSVRATSTRSLRHSGTTAISALRVGNETAEEGPGGARLRAHVARRGNDSADRVALAFWSGRMFQFWAAKGVATRTGRDGGSRSAGWGRCAVQTIERLRRRRSGAPRHTRYTCSRWPSSSGGVRFRSLGQGCLPASLGARWPVLLPVLRTARRSRRRITRHYPRAGCPSVTPVRGATDCKSTRRSSSVEIADADLSPTTRASGGSS